MKNIIIYTTKYGTVGTCAEILSDKLKGETVLCNLKKDKLPNLEEFDQIILGSSVYIGQTSKEIKQFCEDYKEVLLKKRLGLFICAMLKGKTLKEELANAYPEELKKHALILDHFGWGFYFKKMNLIDKALVKLVSKTEKDIAKEIKDDGAMDILENNIYEFAKIMNQI